MQTDAQSLPEWLRLEKDVKSLFTLFGFNVENISIEGRQIDIVATRTDSLSLNVERWAIEVTAEKVGSDKGSKDYQKLELARRSGNADKCMIVSLAGFTDDQKATLRKLDVVAKTYYELEQTVVDLRRYAELRRLELIEPTKKDVDVGYNPNVYVEPTLRVHKEPDKPTGSVLLPAQEWVNSVARRDVGIVGALLGDLGTGKTTVLEREQLRLLDAFLEQPSTSPVPIFIPLSKFKSHSGKIDSLLREIFEAYGIDRYPAQLLRHLAGRGRVVFFLDGLDEIHPLTSTDDVVDTVTNILDYLGKGVRAVISSRSHLFEHAEDELTVFGPYEKQRIVDLQERLRSILSGQATTEMAKMLPFTSDQIKDYLRQSMGDDADLVQSMIDNLYGFREMAKTPVLLAMMRSTLPHIARASDLSDKMRFPLISLYREYLDRWIKRDEGRTQLKKEQRMSLAVSLARSLIVRDEYSAKWPDILAMLHADPLWSENRVDAKTAELDVRNATFLVREEEDRFRFAHRSIMEYLAAKHDADLFVQGSYVPRSLTDGYLRFLHMCIAESWSLSGVNPIVGRSDFCTDVYEQERTVELIASSSLNFPSESPVPLARLSNARVHGRRFRNTRFKLTALASVRFEFDVAEVLSFDKCSLDGVLVTVADIQRIELTGSIVRATKIDLTERDWGRVYIDGAHDTATQISGTLSLRSFVNMATVVSMDSSNHVVVKERGRWIVSVSDLDRVDRFRKALGGVSAGKMSIDSLDPWVKDALDRLVGESWVLRDRSRMPHQVSLHSRAKNLFSSLQSRPFECQDEILALSSALSRSDSQTDARSSKDPGDRAPHVPPKRMRRRRS